VVRPNAHFQSDDVEVLRRLIRENPWGVLVSDGGGELVASHYPLLLDEHSQLALLTHVGRPDEQIHGFGEREMLVIVQGAHGYVSPSWYAPGASRVPTWNFSVAHCYGVPQILEESENLEVLAGLVEHFERHVRDPLLLEPDYAARVAPGTVGIRIPISRFVCKLKLSQDKDPATRANVIAALRDPGRYQNTELAEDMSRALRDSER
jgi:transcriptional regulator